MIDLSIIILNYNTPNLIKQCVKNIEKSISAAIEMYKQSCNHKIEAHRCASLFFDYEIIIVDNGSKTNSRDFLEDFCRDNPSGRLHIIYSLRNRGFAAGHNLGIKTARGKYVLILNPDIVVLNDAIFKMRQFMEAQQEIAILGPGLLNPDRTLQYSCHRFPKFWTPLFTRTVLGRTKFGKKELSRYNMLDYDHKNPRPVDCLFGAALMVRKDFLDKTGGFNEKYFLYYEDIDLCRTAYKIAHQNKDHQDLRFNPARGNCEFQVWYLPQAQMIHYHKRLSARKSLWRSIFNKVFWIHIASHWKYFRQWGIFSKFNPPINWGV